MIIGRATLKDNKILPIEEIKNRLDLLDVAQNKFGYDLKRKGSKYQGGHGQVHTSKNEQCLAIYNTESWHCWHCNRGGDVLNLIGLNEFGEGYSGRGTDFRKVIEMAASWAGVEVEEPTPAEQEEIEKRERVFQILTEACRYWSTQLVEVYDSILSWLETNYGFSETFCQEKLIGFAPPKDDHQLLFKHLIKLGYSEDEIKSSAVVRRDGSSRFYGRVIFPYWYNGQVRYLAARQTILTPNPNSDFERMKYQKLKVRDDENSQISQHIKNDWLLGLDTLRLARKLGRVLITEGAPDQLAAEQAKEPSISPVTVRFKNGDIPRIAELVKEINRVYLCMDNEESQAGQLGALDTAQALEGHGIAIYIMKLPRPEGASKVDVCEFIRDSGIDAFRALYKQAVRLPLYLIRNTETIDDADSFIHQVAQAAKDCRYSPIDQDELIKELTQKLKLKTNLVKNVFKEVFGKNTARRGAEVEIPGLRVQKFEKIMTEPPILKLSLEGAKHIVRLSVDELFDFTSFRNRVYAITNQTIFYPTPPERGMNRAEVWSLAVDSLTKKHLVEIDTPEDASEEFLLQLKIKEVLLNTQYHTNDQNQIALGRVWLDTKNEGWLWFYGARFVQTHLKAYVDKMPLAPAIWDSFQAMGGDKKKLWSNGATIHCWGIRFENQKKEGDKEESA